MDDLRIPRGIATAPTGRVEVNFDGACEPARGGGIATYGYTVHGGGFHHEDRGLAVPPFHPRATNNVAEYVGAICALEWLVRQGYNGEVVLLGDSQLVIRQMEGAYAVRAEHLRPYHERLRQLEQKFRHVEFRWIRREENERADLLSKEAIAEARVGIRGRPETLATAVEPDHSGSEGPG